jgi:hypothetical protein
MSRTLGCGFERSTWLVAWGGVNVAKCPPAVVPTMTSSLLWRTWSREDCCRLLVVMGRDFVSALQSVAYYTVPGWKRMWPSERARPARVNSSLDYQRPLEKYEVGEEFIILSTHPCGTSRVLLHTVKSYDMGPSRFTSHPRGRCAADFYRP